MGSKAMISAIICSVLFTVIHALPTHIGIDHSYGGSFEVTGGIQSGGLHHGGLSGGFVNQGQSSGGRIREGSFREGSFREGDFGQESNLNAAKNTGLSHGSFASGGEQFGTNGAIGAVFPGFVGGGAGPGSDVGLGIDVGLVSGVGLGSSVGIGSGVGLGGGARLGINTGIGFEKRVYKK